MERNHAAAICGAGFLVEVGYLGSKGNHLIDGESNMTYNQLPASYFALGNQLLSTEPGARIRSIGIITNPTRRCRQPTIRLQPAASAVSAVHQRERVPQAAGQLALSRLHVRA